MGGFFAGIVGWLLKRSTVEFVKKVAGSLAGTDDGQVKLAEIAATSAVAMKVEDTAQLKAALEARVATQSAKMNWPVFWWIIAAMMGPPLLMIWGVTIYNFLWWEHGLWPQVHRVDGVLVGWQISDFPPSIKPWIQATIDWLYDPLGLTSGVGTALVAGRFAGR